MSSDFGIDVGYVGFMVGLEEFDFKDVVILYKKYDLFCYKLVVDIVLNVNFYNKYCNFDMVVGVWEKCV